MIDEFQISYVLISDDFAEGIFGKLRCQQKGCTDIPDQLVVFGSHLAVMCSPHALQHLKLHNINGYPVKFLDEYIVHITKLDDLPTPD